MHLINNWKSIKLLNNKFRWGLVISLNYNKILIFRGELSNKNFIF